MLISALYSIFSQKTSVTVLHHSLFLNRTLNIALIKSYNNVISAFISQKCEDLEHNESQYLSFSEAQPLFLPSYTAAIIVGMKSQTTYVMMHF